MIAIRIEINGEASPKKGKEKDRLRSDTEYCNQILKVLLSKSHFPRIIGLQLITFSSSFTLSQQVSYEIVVSVFLSAPSISLQAILNIPLIIKHFIKKLGLTTLLLLINEENITAEGNLIFAYDKKIKKICISSSLPKSLILIRTLLSENIELIFAKSQKLANKLYRRLFQPPIQDKSELLTIKRLSKLRDIFENTIHNKHKTALLYSDQNYYQKIEYPTNPHPYILSQSEVYDSLSLEEDLQLYSHLLEKVSEEIQEKNNLSEDPIAMPITIIKKQAAKYEPWKLMAGHNSVIQTFLYHFYKQNQLKAQINPEEPSENSVQFHAAHAHNDEEKSTGCMRSSTSLKKQTCVFIKQKQANSRPENLQILHLVTKIAKKEDLHPFENEKELIFYVRNCVCPFIASYFYSSQCKKSGDIHQLYLNYYPIALSTDIPLSQKLSIITNLANGLYFLSSMNICHRDLKLENIMVDNVYNPKIIDFGSYSPMHPNSFGKENQNKTYQLRTTRAYNLLYAEMPEVITSYYTKQQFQRHSKYDVYAYGVIIHKLILESSRNREQLGQQIVSHFQYIVKKCTNYVPDHRPLIIEILMYLKTLQELMHKMRGI